MRQTILEDRYPSFISASRLLPIDHRGTTQTENEKFNYLFLTKKARDILKKIKNKSMYN